MAILLAWVSPYPDAKQNDLSARCTRDADERLYQLNKSRKKVHMKTRNKSKRRQKNLKLNSDKCTILNLDMESIREGYIKLTKTKIPNFPDLLQTPLSPHWDLECQLFSSLCSTSISTTNTVLRSLNSKWMYAKQNLQLIQGEVGYADQFYCISRYISLLTKS